MTQCHCETCAKLSGQPPKPSYSQPYRLETEARLILSWPLAKRQEYLLKLSPPRADTLKAEMQRQHSARRTASGTDASPTGSSDSPAIEKQGCLLRHMDTSLTG